jgi:hypothetical protein
VALKAGGSNKREKITLSIFHIANRTSERETRALKEEWNIKKFA